jgi:two-component system sensor histidine kinase VicK
MKNDRLGVVLIAASLLAIAVVGGLAYQYQMSLHRDNARVHGIAITRAVSSLEPGVDKLALMRSLVSIQDNDDFSYLVVVNRAGEKQVEIVAPGSITPAAVMPAQPFAWFGEHNLISPGDGREIREFFAPMLTDGELAGFVRAGYFRSSRGILSSQLSAFGLMALPIFLLTALSYFLIRREIKPLGRLSHQMALVSLAQDSSAATADKAEDYGEFIQRFDNFIRRVQFRVEQLNSEAVSHQTSTRLNSYKQEKAEAVLNSLPDAVLVLDDAGTPTYANQKLELILNRSREAIAGRAPQEWCDNRELLAFLLRHKPTSSMRTATLEYVPDNAPERRMQVSAVPLLSPRDRNIVFGTLFLLRDITNEHSARQAGAEFVAHVAHELKTPLHAVMGYSELLLDRATLSDAEQVNAVNVIHSEVLRMSGLINNLLNITKMESGTLQPVRKRVKLHDLMQDAFESLLNSSLGKDVELELAVPPDLGSVRLDKELFRIAIDNLLGNAIKYSNPGGKVTVSASALDDGQIQIKVRDRGIGIAADDCARIFDKYYRAASAETAARAGHGLGLYLARQIVELHHGTISVNSELGKGTEFVITLKAQPVQLEVSEAL